MKKIIKIISKNGNEYTRNTDREYTHAVMVPPSEKNGIEGVAGYCGNYQLAVKLLMQKCKRFENVYIVEVIK